MQTKRRRCYIVSIFILLLHTELESIQEFTVHPKLTYSILRAICELFYLEIALCESQNYDLGISL